MGSIRKIRMFPLDFEEFLYANGMNGFALSAIREKFEKLETPDEPVHEKIMDLFKKYLLVGGLPEAVNTFIATKNIQAVRGIQAEIHEYYAADASKYDHEKKLKIRRVYDLVPSNMENKKKRVVAQELTAHGHNLFYYDNRSKGEVDYLIDDYDTLSAVPIEVKSGKDYNVHSALNNFVSNEDYHVKKACVLSNERTVMQKGKIVYLPVYFVMFF